MDMQGLFISCWHMHEREMASRHFPSSVVFMVSIRLQCSRSLFSFVFPSRRKDKTKQGKLAIVQHCCLKASNQQCCTIENSNHEFPSFPQVLSTVLYLQLNLLNPLLAKRIIRNIKIHQATVGFYVHSGMKCNLDLWIKTFTWGSCGEMQPPHQSI